MPISRTFTASILAFGLATPALADIVVEDAFARSAGPMGRSGAAFMVIRNTGDADDRLVAAASKIAQRVELHTHKDMGEGVMRMMEVEEGFAVPAGGTHALARGGDHVMFMGLNDPMEEGATVTVTLTFEQAGDIVLEIPVDMERTGMRNGNGRSAGHGNGHGHGKGKGMGNN